MKRKLVTILLLIALYIASQARVYNGLNKGIAWNMGGLEIAPSPAVFLCAGNYDTVSDTYQQYKLLPALFPSLVTDC